MYILSGVCLCIQIHSCSTTLQLTGQNLLIRISNTNSNNHTPEQCHELNMCKRNGILYGRTYRGYDKQELDNFNLQITICNHGNGCPWISPQFLPHRTASSAKRNMYLQTVWKFLLNLGSCKQVILLNHFKITLVVSITSLLAMSFYCLSSA